MRTSAPTWPLRSTWDDCRQSPDGQRGTLGWLAVVGIRVDAPVNSMRGLFGRSDNLSHSTAFVSLHRTADRRNNLSKLGGLGVIRQARYRLLSETPPASRVRALVIASLRSFLFFDRRQGGDFGLVPPVRERELPRNASPFYAPRRRGFLGKLLPSTARRLYSGKKVEIHLTAEQADNSVCVQPSAPRLSPFASRSIALGYCLSV